MRHKMKWAGVILMVILLAVCTLNTQADGKKYKIGDKIANFTYQNEQGKQVSLSTFKGKIVVLNFYASW